MRENKETKKCARAGLPSPRATFGPRSGFVWPAWSFCEVDFLVERLTISRQIKRRSKPKPSFVWFSQNQFGFAVKTFSFFFFGHHYCGDRFPYYSGNLAPICVEDLFLLFTYFWGQVPEILVEVGTDFVQQTFNYLEFNLGKNACGLQ